MEGHAIPIVIDLIMMGLLVGTIIHSIHLSKSLQNFKKIYGEIVPMMHEHAKNLAVNMNQIEEMKKISAEIDHKLKSRVPEALTLKKDLDFLVDRASDMADHLEFMIKFDREREFSSLKRETTLENEDRLDKTMSKSVEIKAEPQPQVSSKPITESFSLTKTAKKLFAQKVSRASQKDRSQEEEDAA